MNVGVRRMCSMIPSPAVFVLGVVRQKRPISIAGRNYRRWICTTSIFHQELASAATPSLQISRPSTSRAHETTLNIFKSWQDEMSYKQQIYCEGSLLHAVQTLHIFADCKTFVDMPLKHDAESTLNKWHALQEAGAVTSEVLASFLRDNFEAPEGELVECAPADWTPLTDNFKSITDPDYKKFAQALHGKWPTLYRKIADKVLVNPERYSIIAVPHPFMVPGGRFREMYYWDSFFTIKGLIASGMMETVRGMVDNMLFLVETFGFIPNGNRVYYLNRSQPPLLAWCVQAYFEATNDVEYVARALPTLRKELAFFQAKRSIMLEGWAGPLYRYTVQTVRPRPESYREDVESAVHLDSEEEKYTLWGDLAAAAESGRDFSSRWFSRHGLQAGKLQGTRTSQIIPVDLNAIICGNIRVIGELCDVVGDIDGSKWCATMVDQMVSTIHQVLWNEARGCWFDFDLQSMSQIDEFYDTNFFPMYTRCTHEGFDGKRVSDYLIKSGALGFPGGLPSSMISSGEQWDFPNSWAPTTWVLIEGLRKCGEYEMSRVIADKWLRKNFDMWKNSGGRMFEKYNVVSPCYKSCGGGEYALQEGFGWTNGVALDLLCTYGNELRWSIGESCECCTADKCTLSAGGERLPGAGEAVIPQTPSMVSLQSLASNASDVSLVSLEPQIVPVPA